MSGSPTTLDLWFDPGMQSMAAISELLKPTMPNWSSELPIYHVANEDEESPCRACLDSDRLFSKWAVIHVEVACVKNSVV
jgi:hypothetical protein